MLPWLSADHSMSPLRSGLLGFAATTFLLSLYNLNTRGVMEPNVVVGMSLFGGGLVQLLAGLLEFPRGNVFGATGLHFLAELISGLTDFT